MLHTYVRPILARHSKNKEHICTYDANESDSDFIFIVYTIQGVLNISDRPNNFFENETSEKV